MGLLLQNAPDVISGLKELVANIDVQQHGSTICLKIEDQTVILGYEVYVSGVRGVEQIYDCAVPIGWNIMRSLCGSGWLPVEVQLRRKQPIDIKHYHCFFQAPMKFNSGQSCLVFSRKWLDRPLELASPALRKHFLARIQEVRSHSQSSLLEQAYKVIVMLLSQKRCSREQLAWHLSLHPRTLSRRLADSGTSFRELQRAACHEMARQLLRGTRLSIPAIGALLGYSDGTAFSRSLSKWEGVSPARWRKRLTISH